MDLRVVLLNYMSPYWEVIALDNIALLILDVNTWDDITVLGLDDDHFLQT